MRIKRTGCKRDRESSVYPHEENKNLVLAVTKSQSSVKNQEDKNDQWQVNNLKLTVLFHPRAKFCSLPKIHTSATKTKAAPSSSSVLPQTQQIN